MTSRPRAALSGPLLRRPVVCDPRQLSGAVDAARASLQDALSLGEELLEAFREVQTQSPSDDQTTEES